MAKRLSAALLAVAIALAGCSQGGGLTGSLGALAAKPAPPVIQNTPESRMKHLAWNMAWARVCGFNVDRTRIKGSYIAYETAQGLSPAELGQLDQSYDKAEGIIFTGIASRPDMCTPEQIEAVRGNLARYMSGDFLPVAAQQPT